LKIVVLSTFCTGRVRHWGVVYGPIVLFKSDHKASCVSVLILVSTLMKALEQATKRARTDD
jgi:hypothetical protein